LARAHGNGDLLTSTVKNLKERGHTVTHTDVQVSLGALDVIMQVVTEGKNYIASALTLVGLVVTGLKKEGSITMSVEVTDTSKLGWRILQVSVTGRSTRHVLAELIEEHVAENDIILIIEADGENHDNTITILLEPDRLVGAVVDLDDLATRGTLRGLVHHLVKDSSKEVTRHTRCKTRNLCSVSLRINLAEGDTNGKIVFGLRGSKKAAINLLEVLLTTVGLNLIPAFAGDGNIKLASIGPKMPDDLVEICDRDIDFLSLFSNELSVYNIINDTVI